jgi:hypothetical protein
MPLATTTLGVFAEWRSRYSVPHLNLCSPVRDAGLPENGIGFPSPPHGLRFNAPISSSTFPATVLRSEALTGSMKAALRGLTLSGLRAVLAMAEVLLLAQSRGASRWLASPIALPLSKSAILRQTFRASLSYLFRP